MLGEEGRLTSINWFYSFSVQKIIRQIQAGQKLSDGAVTGKGHDAGPRIQGLIRIYLQTGEKAQFIKWTQVWIPNTM